MKRLRRMLRKEAGQALPLALILLFVGAAIITVILDLSTTNLKATEAIERNTWDLYAADAGIDDGLWKVRYNYLPNELLGDWTESTYATYDEDNPYIYTLYDTDDPNDTVSVNEQYVEVKIRPIWVLENLEELLVQDRTPTSELLTYGTLINDGVYEVSIFHSGSLDPLEILRIGCWLPPGFEYVDGSSNLEQDPGETYYCIPTISNYNGGSAIKWEYAGIDYADLPAQGNKKIVTFQFTPTDNPVDAFCWTRITPVAGVELSWDTSKRIFEIISTAPNESEKQTTIVSHTVKREFQALGGAVSGDYQATGLTLLRDHDNDGGWFWDRDKRERLYRETATPIPPTTDPPTSPIPDDASVEKIFIYWAGWKCKPWYAWDYTDEQMNAWPTAKQIDKVKLKVKVGTDEMPSTLVTADEEAIQVMRNGTEDDQHGWSYSCFADVTSTVTNYFKDHDVPYYGNATYTLEHWNVGTQSSSRRYALYNWTTNHSGETIVGYTQYPLGSPKDGDQEDSGYENDGDQTEHSWAAWSVIIIYSSPSTAGHHLYVFDEFLNCDSFQTVSFTIKGFLAPEDVAEDPNAARMTCFVGEGDYHYGAWGGSGDNFQVNGTYMTDSINPLNNVWNARSNVLGGAYSDDGIDIDTFIAGGGTIIQPGDTEAEIDIPTAIDIWNLVYIILSFRSEITSGGAIDYTIE